MSNAFERALAVGLKGGLALSRAALTYTRPVPGDDPLTVSLTGTQGKKLFKIQEPGQVVVVVKSVDFLIAVADLVVDDVATEPAKYDEIARVIGTKKRIYKVLPMGKEIPLFEYADTGQTVYRIHTKFDREEPV
ncbi:hypothetical protein [Paremcibacter congregatus]|uniref:hypothetical protein n=1 Tax=Paremcibacter congregatus TaxID=2043170 RepID=UPI003A8E5016